MESRRSDEEGCVAWLVRGGEFFTLVGKAENDSHVGDVQVVEWHQEPKIDFHFRWFSHVRRLDPGAEGS